MDTSTEQFMLTIIGILCSVALGLFSLLIALAAVAGLLLLIRSVIGIIATIRHNRKLKRSLQTVDAVEAVAEAIAQEAGHNWTAAMMPGYRADFRRQASAAIHALAALEPVKGRK